MTVHFAGFILSSMLDMKKSMLPLLLPAIVLVPLAGLMVFLLAGQWHAKDERAAAMARVGDASTAISTELHAAVQRQRNVTELLGRSPLVRLWMESPGGQPSASGSSLAQMTREEAASCEKLLPGAAVYLAGAGTRVLYRDGSGVGALSPDEPRDAWYFDALATEGIALSVDSRQVRTSLRVMEGAEPLGVVTCVSGATALAAAAFAAVCGGSGGVAALADEGGGIVHAAGAATTGTVFDLFDDASEKTVRAAMKAAARPGLAAYAMARMKGRTMLVSLTRTADFPGWYLLVSREAPLGMPLGRCLILLLVPIATLAALLAVLIVIISGRMSWAAARMQALEQARDAAARGLARRHGAAARVDGGLGDLGARAGSLAREAEDAARSIAQATDLFTRLDQRDSELRSGIAGRISLLGDVTAAARDAIERSRALAAAAGAISRSAAAGEEELSRLIASEETLSASMRKAANGADAVVYEAGRVKLLSLNAALDAQRSDDPAAARIAGDIGRRAEEAAARARSLAEAVQEADAGREAMGRAAREAGRMIHDAAVASRDAANAAAGAWEGAELLLSRMDAAGASAGQLHDHASLWDQGLSVVEGIGRGMARLVALGKQIAGIAEGVRTDAADAARAAPDDPPS